ncbi:Aerotolerance protein BatA [hydrothermal vent metagenome]|uniref:Aerotolerance protein BatA n=1 Tax=hydrothermal vent metagenome TaxID=652676 RepID=A0A3B1BQY0_9ZZZZ
MLTLEWPWILALLPLPLVLRWLLPARQNTTQAALRVPNVSDFQLGESPSTAGAHRKHWQWLLASLIWLTLLLAASRPQWLGDEIDAPISGRDLMLAIDLSGSMTTEDFSLRGRTVNRLIASKYVASDFIKHREGDRIGLILFGRNAYLQAPLTFDRKTVNILLQEAAIGLAGRETAIGDAIGLAIKRLKDQDKDSRVLVLMTDGANTAGEVSPLKAAELAAKEGLKIYTIGIGADEMIRRSMFGTQRINPSADLDEKTLTAIATQTGGRYFRARNTRELKQIYSLLDELEPVEQDSLRFRPIRALFYWPLGLALSLLLLMTLPALKARR